jgi:hypothetical protein
MLLERLFEGCPLIYPQCSREMRIIAFVTHANPVQRMLTHIGEPIHPPVIAPARGSPGGDDQLEPAPNWDGMDHTELEYEFDQRVSWQPP